MKLHPMDLNLGLDQVGEMYGAVMPKLADREVFMCEDRSFDDRCIFKVLGSRGTNLRAEMTDNGWKVRRWPAQR